MERYSYPIFVYEERSGGVPVWIGNFPGLNGCWVEGVSKEEVLARAPFVLHEFSAACRALEWRLPEPPALFEFEGAGAGEVFLIEESVPEDGER